MGAWVAQRELHCNCEQAVSISTRLGKGPCLETVVALYVQIVSEDTQREDGHGERIASKAGVTTKELRDNFVVVF